MLQIGSLALNSNSQRPSEGLYLDRGGVDGDFCLGLHACLEQGRCFFAENMNCRLNVRKWLLGIFFKFRNGTHPLKHDKGIVCILVCIFWKDGKIWSRCCHIIAVCWGKKYSTQINWIVRIFCPWTTRRRRQRIVCGLYPWPGEHANAPSFVEHPGWYGFATITGSSSDDQFPAS